MVSYYNIPNLNMEQDEIIMHKKSIDKAELLKKILAYSYLYIAYILILFFYIVLLIKFNNFWWTTIITLITSLFYVWYCMVNRNLIIYVISPNILKIVERALAIALVLYPITIILFLALIKCL